MRGRKRYETFFNTVYSYETRKPEEKQKKNKAGDENHPLKEKIMSCTRRTTRR